MSAPDYFGSGDGQYIRKNCDPYTTKLNQGGYTQFQVDEAANDEPPPVQHTLYMGATYYLCIDMDQIFPLPDQSSPVGSTTWGTTA